MSTGDTFLLRDRRTGAEYHKTPEQIADFIEKTFGSRYLAEKVEVSLRHGHPLIAQTHLDYTGVPLDVRKG